MREKERFMEPVYPKTKKQTKTDVADQSFPDTDSYQMRKNMAHLCLPPKTNQWLIVVS